jgi:hypothetical protein
MKLKTITKTNSYKHITLGDIKDNWKNQYIHTPDGFKEIKDFFFTKRNKTICLSLNNAMTLICDPEHKLLTSNGEKFAKDLDNNDKLFGYGRLVSFVKSEGPEEDLYDISIDNPHWYYTSGVVSHNSIVICNNAAACIKRGLKVLHITCELSWYKTACRYCGILSGEPIDDRFGHQQYITDRLRKVKLTYKGDLAIYEFPPDMISTKTILSLVDQLRKTQGWVPDVIAVDYLELLLSDNQYFNQDEYKRQKKVSTEIRQLAKLTGTYVITATQSNRVTKDNKQEEVMDINRVSESFGKIMPVDYVVSINQNRLEYSGFEVKEQEEGGEKKTTIVPAKMRLYIAKNRNGPKFRTVNALVTFHNMLMKEMPPDMPIEETNNV